MNKKHGVAVGLASLLALTGAYGNASTYGANKACVNESTRVKFCLIEKLNKKIVKEEFAYNSFKESVMENRKSLSLENNNYKKYLEGIRLAKEESIKASEIVVKEENKTEVASEVEVKAAEASEVKENIVEVAAQTPAENVVSEATEVKIEAQPKDEQIEENVVSLSGFVLDNLNVRGSNDTNSQILGVLELGEKVEGVLEDGWIKINYNGNIGYISSTFVSNIEAVAEEVLPETKPIEEKVENNKPVEEVKTEEVKKDEVKTEKPVEKLVTPKVHNTDSSVIGSIVDAAYSLIGTDYVFGGSSPEGGFDCSGFTMYLYQTYAGVTLDRITTGQALNGFEVSSENMQAGDIICFQNDWSDSIDHVGIYVGDGTYIHAATEERGVVADSIEGSYFKENVVTIRRILN